MKVKRINVDGTEVELELNQDELFDLMDSVIGISDTVNLRNGTHMFVADSGALVPLPINLKATRLYHSVCIPGTTWPIRGDVFIVPDEE